MQEGSASKASSGEASDADAEAQRKVASDADDGAQRKVAPAEVVEGDGEGDQGREAVEDRVRNAEEEEERGDDLLAEVGVDVGSDEEDFEKGWGKLRSAREAYKRAGLLSEGSELWGLGDLYKV